MAETRRLKNAVIFIQTILSFVLSRKTLNDKIILKYFQQLKRRKSCIVLFAASIENLKNLK